MPAKNILFVYAPGGPPLEHTLSRVARCGNIHVLALWPMPKHTEAAWRPHCASITAAWNGRPHGAALVDLIYRHAQECRADALLTVSEFAVVAGAEAARRLGLRGVGSNAVRARSKRLMRQTWQDAGVPIPRFHPVDGEQDLYDAYGKLTRPLLLKAAWGAGSVGQVIIETEDQIPAAWADANAAVADSDAAGYGELHEPAAAGEFIAEEIIDGSTRTWYPEGSGYGDYVSVEGIVAGGRYHPLCVTGRIPTIPPFTELSNLAPCALPEPLQRTIEAVATQAVDALGLDTCGTHTEIKLADHGGLYLIESAARLGGVMVASEIEAVFGYDPIQMLVRELLGEAVDYPDRMLISGNGAAGSLSVIATDSAGVPWREVPVWDSRMVDWRPILSAGSTIEAVPGLTIPDGTPMPAYDLAGGANNYAGIFFLRAADAETLKRDCYSVLDNLERALLAGHATSLR